MFCYTGGKVWVWMFVLWTKRKGLSSVLWMSPCKIYLVCVVKCSFGVDCSFMDTNVCFTVWLKNLPTQIRKLYSVGVAAVLWEFGKPGMWHALSISGLLIHVLWCLGLPTGLLTGVHCRWRRTQRWRSDRAQKFRNKSQLRCSKPKEAGRHGSLDWKMGLESGVHGEMLCNNKNRITLSFVLF